jgi:ribosome-associated protein
LVVVTADRKDTDDRRVKHDDPKTEDRILTSKAGASHAPKKTAPHGARNGEQALLSRILVSLDDDKSEDVVTIELAGRSSLADWIVIANGRSHRHVSAIAEHLARRLKEAGYGTRPVDGLQSGDWVLVDAGDVIVHIFRPEVRAYYDLEGMWSVDEPARATAR